MVSSPLPPVPPTYFLCVIIILLFVFIVSATTTTTTMPRSNNAIWASIRHWVDANHPRYELKWVVKETLFDEFNEGRQEKVSMRTFTRNINYLADK